MLLLDTALSSAAVWLHSGEAAPAEEEAQAQEPTEEAAAGELVNKQQQQHHDDTSWDDSRARLRRCNSAA